MYLVSVRPGVTEYQIEAEITHEFLWNRATGHAYSPIIASGASACVLHYTENNRECKDGDVIPDGFRAEYANYAADLTRCIPVSGKFTKRQKDVYNAVLRVMRAATKMLVVGNIIPKYHEEVGKLMEQELIGLGLWKRKMWRNRILSSHCTRNILCMAQVTSLDWMFMILAIAMNPCSQGWFYLWARHLYSRRKPGNTNWERYPHNRKKVR